MRQRPGLILVLGFGGLLLLMAVAEIASLLLLNTLRQSDAQLQARFLVRNRTLEQIRSNIYLSGTYVRDSLLAPEPSGAKAQLASVEGLRRDTEAAIDSYARSIDSQEAAPFRALRAEIDAYWKVLDRTFAWSAEERNKYRYAFLYQELMPRRTTMLQIADRIEALNEESLKRGDERLGAVFERLQLGLVAMITITLLGGAALAGLTIFHILRLEGEARRRLEESVQAQASLQELSAKLVRAQEEERRRVSRELHDEVGQAFSAVLMESENLLDLEPAREVRPHLEAIRGLAEKGMNEIRNMALLLRPSMLDDFGLVPALDWQARETAKRTGMRVEVSSEVADELPEEHKTCIYRVVQEALNNCARHAQATTVQVAVQSQTGQILLSVQDDGSGFDQARIRGLGLLGMEERVRHLGGTFEIDSRPGRGTLLQVKLPLAAWNGDRRNGTSPHPAG
ncbi:MAG: MCP four helix bundle domain-containing protein [Acidobacteriia bacterium]|nr:MCP four helix bundle domain-containing protein [Terriglobia bacterium]